ncbi:hypothetical protein BGX28_003561 [Mortierella sp. GBA30]|nr:hypothetical protein BGX28_003561 [Mortierella sp. GBA30]
MRGCFHDGSQWYCARCLRIYRASRAQSRAYIEPTEPVELAESGPLRSSTALVTLCEGDEQEPKAFYDEIELYATEEEEQWSATESGRTIADGEESRSCTVTNNAVASANSTAAIIENTANDEVAALPDVTIVLFDIAESDAATVPPGSTYTSGSTLPSESTALPSPEAPVNAQPLANEAPEDQPGRALVAMIEQLVLRVEALDLEVRELKVKNGKAREL